MEPTQLYQAWEKGGWPLVFLIAALAFGKWYCSLKLEQDKRFHDERMKEQQASQQMLGCLADAIIALVYKNINNEDAARVMADLASKRIEAIRTAERVASQ
jgi:hypothetical protein